MSIQNIDNISGLTLQLDASDSSSLTKDVNGNVSKWKNKKYSSDEFTPFNAATITYSATGMNGKPTLQFNNNATDGMVSTANNYYSNLSNFYYFSVLKTTSEGSRPTPCPFALVKTAGTVSRIVIYTKSGGVNSFSSFYAMTYNSSGFVPNSMDTPMDTNIIFGVSVTNGTQTFFINGTQGTPITSALTTLTGENGLYVSIGGSTYTDNGFKGNMSEILVYTSSLTTTNRQQIEGYLAQKWGLQSSLPTTHPFYQTAQINASSLYLSGYLNNYSVTNPAFSSPLVSAYANYIIASGVGFTVNSDERIKKNIQPLSSANSFELVKALKPASFEYIDSMKGTIPKYGYLAQEVEAVLPNIVYKNVGYITNIFEMVKIDGTKIVLNEKTTESLAIGTKVQFYDAETNSFWRQVKEIINEKTFIVNESFLEGVESLFLYGQEVEDYRSIDTDQIYTVMLSALQETQTKFEKNKKKIEELQLLLIQNAHIE